MGRFRLKRLRYIKFGYVGVKPISAGEVIPSPICTPLEYMVLTHGILCFIVIWRGLPLSEQEVSLA